MKQNLMKIALIIYTITAHHKNYIKAFTLSTLLWNVNHFFYDIISNAL